MKRFISIVLTIAFALSLMTTVSAANSADTTLKFDLTCGGEHRVTKNTNDIVEVTFTLENHTDAAADYMISSAETQIYYDHTFFEYLGTAINQGIGLKATPIVYTNDEHRILIDGIEAPKSYSAKQVVATLQFKVIKTQGSSTIMSKGNIAMHNGSYKTASEDLVVVIGNAPVTPIYTLTFETNGGTPVTEVKKEEGSTVDLSVYQPRKDGFVLEGWYSDVALTNKVTSVLLDGNKTVYAKWVVPTVKYTLTFSNGEFPAITKDAGTTVDLSGYVPTRNGYTFGGWYTDLGLTNKVTSITLTDNTTVYAKWSKDSSGTGGGTTTQNYTLTFDTNGGDSLAAVSVQKNTNVDLTKYIPKKDGYTFMGWYSDEELENKIESIKITKNTTIYAGWEKSGSDEPIKPNSSYIPDILNASEHFAYIVGYEDGTVHPDANITRAEVATIVFRLLTDNVREESLSSTNDFRDVSADDWYNTSVSTMAAMGVLKGYEGNFRPNDPITRAEFAAIVARLSEKTAGNMKIDFEDIAGHWAEPEILKAASFGWVQGFDGYYRPDDAITRAEAMTIINRVLCRVPENSDDLLSDMKAWTDNMDTSKWYYINVQEATNSHDFEMKADGIHEKWTSLKENPNWAEIEQ